MSKSEAHQPLDTPAKVQVQTAAQAAQAEAEFNSKEEAAKAEAKAIAEAKAAHDQRLKARVRHRKAFEATPLTKLEKEIPEMKMWLDIAESVCEKKRAEEREVAEREVAELKEREEAIVAKKKVVDQTNAEAMAKKSARMAKKAEYMAAKDEHMAAKAKHKAEAEDLRRMMAEDEEKKEHISKKRSRDWEGVE